MRTCPKCGMEIETDSKFCRNCGEPIVEENPLIENELYPMNDTESVSALSEPATTKKSRKKALIAAIGAGILVIAGVIVACLLTFSKPAPPSEPMATNNGFFTVTSSDFRNRFNGTASGSIKQISNFDNSTSEKYEIYSFHDAQLQPDIEISLISDRETNNIWSILLTEKVHGETSDLFVDYMLCVFHACDPTATIEDDIDLLETMADVTYSDTINAAYSKPYEKNGMAYSLTVKLDETTFIVIPGLD